MLDVRLENSAAGCLTARNKYHSTIIVNEIFTFFGYFDLGTIRRVFEDAGRQKITVRCLFVLPRRRADSTNSIQNGIPGCSETEGLDTP